MLQARPPLQYYLGQKDNIAALPPIHIVARTYMSLITRDAPLFST